MNKPTHTTVVAYLALAVALGGTAIAAQGRLGASDLERVKFRLAQEAADVRRRSRLSAGPDEKLIGGGGGFVNVGSPVGAVLVESKPAPKQNAWEVRGYTDPLSAGGTLRAYAICLPR